MATHFLELLDAEQRAARRQTLVAIVVVVLLLVPAALILPYAGLAVHVVAAGLGVAIGLPLAGRVTKSYEASLKERWQRWMRFAVAAESIPEIARKVEGKNSRNRAFTHAAGLTVFWVLEVALLLLAFDGSGSLWLAIPVLLVNGVVAGILIGRSLKLRKWSGEFRSSVDELLQSGELGLWGVV